MSDPSCNACSGTWPGSDHFIADLGLSMAYLHEDQFFPGWTVVVFKRHATELFHLAPTERIQLMEEVNLVAKTLAQVYEPMLRSGSDLQSTVQPLQQAIQNASGITNRRASH